MDEVETAGYLVSADYYTALINTEKKNISTLENEFNSLSYAFGEAIKNGNITEGSEAWNEMYLSILDVQTAIEDANKSLIEYQANLRQLNWDRFDKLEDYISQIQTESDFLIDLMSNETLYNKDTGKDTIYATTLKGLHAVNYNAYMAQSDDYAKEISNIDKDLANDPYNTTLIERRQELLKLQQEAISNAEDEKQSIKSLISDGFDAMKDALDEIIDKRKEALDAESDLYDYEKSIEEKTENIASLRKQLMALSGDDSEETQAKRQQLNESLSDAETELSESEYDQWKTDYETMLSNLSDNVEEWLNARLDNLDGLIQETIDQTNANASAISTTITTEAGNVGYTITDQMRQIWSSSDGLTGVVTTYGNNFQNIATNTLNTINSIKLYVENLSKKADADAAAKIKAAEAKKTTVTTTAKTAAKSTTNTSTNKNTTSSSSSSGNFFVYRKDSYPKGKLQINTSIVDFS